MSAAMEALLKLFNKATFGTWEEHIRKYHAVQQRGLSFDVLNAIAPHVAGLTLDALLAELNNPAIKRESLRLHLMQLIEEGFLYQEPSGDDSAPYRFRITPLRLWWKLHRPQATA